MSRHRATTRVASTQEDNFPVAYRRLSDAAGRPIRWLWPGRIARGKVSLIGL